MAKKKVVVAYSGGLDTSFTVMYQRGAIESQRGKGLPAGC